MRTYLALGLTLLLSACVVHRLEVAPVNISEGAPIAITTPVKAHLNDGSTVVFASGINVSENTIRGDGILYDLTLENSREVTEISVDDVAAMESYQTPVSTGATAVASTASTAAYVGLGMAAILLLFGSCPTVYALDADSAVLEAELFSYSIAPTFESRDIDRLGATPSADGRLSIEVRNEMLETHYIDQVELLEISHQPDQRAYPDQKGRPIVVGPLIAPSAATDNEGRDVLASVAVADGKAWRASSERLASITQDDRIDHVDVEFDVPEDANDAALVLRMRNSLLNTVLLYDVMLKDQGFAALEWLGNDVNRFGNKISTGLWYRKHMGLDISVWRDGRYRNVARIGDQGPIAWSERAVKLASGEGGKLKIRLSFVADNWRFDQVALALDADRGKSRTVVVSSATTPEGARPDIPVFLTEADNEYLISRPGDSVRLTFDVGNANEGIDRSFFLASEGYYMEWMRAEWLTGGPKTPFTPNERSLMRAIEQYTAKRDGLREQFEAIRIETR